MTNLAVACLEDIGESLVSYKNRCYDLAGVVLDWAYETQGLDLQQLSVEPKHGKLRPSCKATPWDFHEVVFDPHAELVHDAWHPTPKSLPEYLAETFPGQQVRFYLSDRTK